MAKDTFRTSFDIPLRFKDYLDSLAYGEKKQVLEKLLDLLVKDSNLTLRLLADRLTLSRKGDLDE